MVLRRFVSKHTFKRYCSCYHAVVRGAWTSAFRMSGFLLVVLFLSLGGVTQGQMLVQAPELVKGTLKNGLTYYIYPNKFPKDEAVFRLFIKSGSVYEEEDQRGLAHFLEHMAFNGTSHFPGNSLTEFLEEKGAKFGVDFNAHTSMNETVYKLKMAVDKNGMLDSTLMVLSDIAGGLLLDSAQIEDERGVIVSEWRQQTGPKREAQLALLMELLNDSRYSKRLTIGDTAVIKHFAHSRIRDYYEKWYSPKVMAVAVVGDVDVRKTKKMIRKRFGKLRSSWQGVPPNYSIPDYNEVHVKKISHESLDKVELNIIELMDASNGVQTEEEYRLYLQKMILNRLIKGRFSALSFDQIPYDDAGFSLGDFLNVKGMLLGSVELIPGHIEEGIIRYAYDAEQMFRYGFVPLEIEKVKTQYLKNLRDKSLSETPKASSAFMNEIYSDYFAGNKFVTGLQEYLLAKKYLNEIDSVTLVKMLHNSRHPEKSHYLISYFDKVKDQIPSDTKLTQIFDSIKNAPVKPYELNYQVPDNLLSKEPLMGKVVKQKSVPEIAAREMVFENGARVLYQHSDRDKNHLILSAIRPGGLYALDSTDYVNGLVASQLTALSGAGNFSREALSHFLSDKTVSLRFVIEKTRSGIIGSTDRDDLQTFFKLMYLKWSHPSADSTVFNQIKEKSIEKFITSNKTAVDTFYRDLSVMMKGNSYVSQELSDSLLNSDLRFERMLPVFNQSFGSARGFNFVLIGDFPFEEIEPLIKQYIGGLPSGSVQNKYLYQGPVIPDTSLVLQRSVGNNPRTSVNLVFQENRIDQEVMLYNIKAKMMASILTTRFLQILREEMGKVYSISVSSGATIHPSVLRRSTIRFSCNPDDAEALVSQCFMEMAQLIDDPELLKPIMDNVKLNMIQKWKTQKQKNIYWSQGLRNCWFNDASDWRSMTKYDEIVNAITPLEMAEMIQSELIDTPVLKALLNPQTVDNE